MTNKNNLHIGKKKKQFDAEENLVSIGSAIKGKSWKTGLGRFGEDFVVKQLEADGWLVLERNWRAGRMGELDIICQDPEGIIVFIEVKTRVINEVSSGFLDHGFDAINLRKTKRMVKAAMLYLATRYITKPVRFDVVCVTCGKYATNLSPQITHAKGAFVPT